jgi:hypothetical protein
MRARHVSLTLVTVLPLSFGCQSGLAPVPVGTFINESDPNQSLELKIDPSQTPNVLIRITMATGMNKYVGKSVGTYTLKTQQEHNAGTFVWRRISFQYPDGRLEEVWLTTDTGKQWTLTLQPDGSLRDPSGVIWKHPKTRA